MELEKGRRSKSTILDQLHDSISKLMFIFYKSLKFYIQENRISD